MRTIKKLDSFLLKTFLPLFIMTFGICLFIFLMQFLWQYVDDMVGKGIEMAILAKMFFHTALTMAPRALPLAILFASLMTFGNLGEQFELLAMKASGISLLRIMQPLGIFLLLIAIGTLFFQNNVIPVSQVKMWTMLSSIRQKSPELEIPESTFYSAIKGINLYVREKDKKSKLLKDVMIYDYTEGFNMARIIRADSGRLKSSADKNYLILTLYSGESFQNYKNSNNERVRDAKDAVPFRRESFDTMERLIEFNANFNMRDESMFEGRYIGKNLAGLKASIDTMEVQIDSIKTVQSKALYAQSYQKTLGENQRNISATKNGSEANMEMEAARINFDSLYTSKEPTAKVSLLTYSKHNIERMQMDYGYKALDMGYQLREINRHYTEMHKKFTLSFACLVFFFIGAPLGAIIRKGGLGTPAVISVLLFVVYYVVDNMGYKMARDGIWTPWIGMWLSSMVLLPLGIFLTYKAVNDSVILNADTYLDSLKKMIGKREMRKIEKKELIIETPDYGKEGFRLEILKNNCTAYLDKHKRWLNYLSFWKHGGTDIEAEKIAHEVEGIVETLNNSDQNLVLNKLMDFPVINSYHLMDFKINGKWGRILAIFIPIGGLIYLIAVYRRKLLRQDIATTAKVSDELIEIITNKTND